MVKAICNNCGDTTSIRKGRYDESELHFCNRDCRNEYYAKKKQNTIDSIIHSIDNGYNTVSDITSQVDISSSYVRRVCDKMVEEGKLEKNTKGRAYKYYIKGD